MIRRAVITGLLIVGGLLVMGFFWTRGDIDAPLEMRIAPLRNLPPAPREVTLAVMGTSLTAHVSWPEAAAEALAACLAQPVRLSRHASGGKTSAWGLTQTDAVIAAAPDIVLVEFSINDADIRRGIGPERSAANHREILDRLAAGLPEAALVLMRLNRAYGLRGALRPRLLAYEDNLPAIAESGNAGFLDVRPAWAEALEGDARQTIMPDGLHPNDAATREIVAPIVAAALCAAAGR